MKLTLFNGSPRGERSNTRILMENFERGFVETAGNRVEVHYLAREQDVQALREAFVKADVALLAFPLYTDAMPGMVKAFIEALQPLCGRPGNPPIAFLVQSGFPEALHGRYVERYLEKLARRLGCRYLGTIVKGGVEGIQSQPPDWTRKLFEHFYQLGRTFGAEQRLDPARLRSLAKPERYPLFSQWVFRLLSKTGLLNFYWDGQLKQNLAYERRFARPYVED